MIGLDVSWHDERAYKTTDFIMHSTTTSAASIAAAAAAGKSSTFTRVGWNLEGGEEGKVEGEEEGGSSGRDSSRSVTTRGSITVLDMTAWIKAGKGTEKSVAEKGAEKTTELGACRGVEQEIVHESEVGVKTGLTSSTLAPVLGATDLGLAPVRVLEWKRLDESKVSETNLV